MIRLRKLNIKDAPLMLEWMKDEEISAFFITNFADMTLDNVIDFINDCNKKSVHFAIANEDDIYLGTISLKNIDLNNKNAEYAISLRGCAISKGIAKDATDLVLDYAFNDLGLKKVYLNVLEDNIRAIKFYEKYGFLYEGEFKKHIYHQGCLKNLRWYARLKD